MPYDRFLVAPINGSLQTDLRPWLIPEQSFTTLNNAYVFRGRVRKRFGEQLMGVGADSSLTAPLLSRVRIQVATITGGAASGTVPGNYFAIGQLFSIVDEIFTVWQTGTPATMLDTGTTTVKTYNTTTGAFNFAGNPSPDGTPVYFYPDQPIMGLTNYELGPINDQPSFAFDMQFAYEYNGAWNRSTLGIPPVFHGTNFEFFWSTNWAGFESWEVVLFTTNFHVHLGLGLVTDDPIWAFSTEFPTPGWQPFSYSPDPTINTLNQQPYTVTQTTTTAVTGDTIANYVQSARIILPFKDRLVLLNTIENNALGATPFNTGTPTTTGITPTNYLTSTNTAFVNRCRYSHNGSPFAANAWLEPNFVYVPSVGSPQVQADGAGFIDATTEEAIVSAEFIKDRLIVYFERSTWELAYTGNQVLPFVWQKINTELGSEATFSTVPFDKIVLGIGNTGVHACNGANVERIDNLIPDNIFEIGNKNEGVMRVAGIRDYFTEMVYWTFPSSGENGSTQVFPNRLLFYNYKTGAWAQADDTITTWGYFEQQTDTTWATAQGTWQEADFTWNSGVVQAQFRQVIAGNQQGFIFLIVPDFGRNAPVLQITNMNLTLVAPIIVQLKIINHNLANGDYIFIENAQGATNLNGLIFTVAVVDVNTINLPMANFLNGTYIGGGTATRVSNIEIESKQLNPYVNKGRNVYLAYIDFCVQKTENGQITVDYFPSSTELSMIDQADVNDCALGTNVLETSPYALYPLEEFQERLWHRVYFQTEGEFIQFYMSFKNNQITNPNIAFSKFEMEGFMLFTQPTSARLQ